MNAIGSLKHRNRWMGEVVAQPTTIVFDVMAVETTFSAQNLSAGARSLATISSASVIDSSVNFGGNKAACGDGVVAWIACEGETAARGGIAARKVEGAGTAGSEKAAMALKAAMSMKVAGVAVSVAMVVLMMTVETCRRGGEVEEACFPLLIPKQLDLTKPLHGFLCPFGWGRAW
jgi:hypothetical protein